MSARVLVTDGGARSALAIVRSLGRAGHEPYVVASRLPAIAAASRYAAGSDRVPSPGRDPEGFVAALVELGTRWDIDVLIPTTDAAMAAVLPVRDRLGRMMVPAPDADAFRRVANRSCLLGQASALGIPVPEQHVLQSRSEADAAAAQLPYPLAIKRSGSTPLPPRSRHAPRVVYCATPTELERSLDQFPDEAYPLLAQRLVNGPGLGVFLLVWEGRTLASFAHRRIREKPPTGGASVFRESVAMDPQLLRWSEALLERFDWRGVAMIEFKYDEASETPFLMEVNGRFWGSLQLAVDAGVDFPKLLLDVATGRDVPPPPAYRAGVKTRWLWGEVDHLAALLSSRGASPNGGGRLRPLASALGSWLIPARLEVLKLRDPAPFLVESTEWIKAVTRR